WVGEHVIPIAVGLRPAFRHGGNLVFRSEPHYEASVREQPNSAAQGAGTTLNSEYGDAHASAAAAGSRQRAIPVCGALTGRLGRRPSLGQLFPSAWKSPRSPPRYEDRSRRATCPSLTVRNGPFRAGPTTGRCLSRRRCPWQRLVPPAKLQKSDLSLAV